MGRHRRRRRGAVGRRHRQLRAVPRPPGRPAVEHRPRRRPRPQRRAVGRDRARPSPVGRRHAAVHRRDPGQLAGHAVAGHDGARADLRRPAVGGLRPGMGPHPPPPRHPRARRLQARRPRALRPGHRYLGRGNPRVVPGQRRRRGLQDDPVGEHHRPGARLRRHPVDRHAALLRLERQGLRRQRLPQGRAGLLGPRRRGAGGSPGQHVGRLGLGAVVEQLLWVARDGAARRRGRADVGGDARARLAPHAERAAQGRLPVRAAVVHPAQARRHRRGPAGQHRLVDRRRRTGTRVGRQRRRNLGRPGHRHPRPQRHLRRQHRVRVPDAQRRHLDVPRLRQRARGQRRARHRPLGRAGDDARRHPRSRPRRWVRAAGPFPGRGALGSAAHRRSRPAEQPHRRSRAQPGHRRDLGHVPEPGRRTLRRSALAVVAHVRPRHARRQRDARHPGRAGAPPGGPPDRRGLPPGLPDPPGDDPHRRRPRVLPGAPLRAAGRQPDRDARGHAQARPDRQARHAGVHGRSRSRQRPGHADRRRQRRQRVGRRARDGLARPGLPVRSREHRRVLARRRDRALGRQPLASL